MLHHLFTQNTINIVGWMFIHFVSQASLIGFLFVMIIVCSWWIAHELSCAFVVYSLLSR